MIDDHALCEDKLACTEVLLQLCWYACVLLFNCLPDVCGVLIYFLTVFANVAGVFYA